MCVCENQLVDLVKYLFKCNNLISNMFTNPRNKNISSRSLHKTFLLLSFHKTFYGVNSLRLHQIRKFVDNA